MEFVNEGLMKNKIGIYKITNLISGRKDIGFIVGRLGTIGTVTNICKTPGINMARRTLFLK